MHHPYTWTHSHSLSAVCGLITFGHFAPVLTTISKGVYFTLDYGLLLHPTPPRSTHTHPVEYNPHPLPQPACGPLSSTYHTKHISILDCLPHAHSHQAGLPTALPVALGATHIPSSPAMLLAFPDEKSWPLPPGAFLHLASQPKGSRAEVFSHPPHS